MKKKRIGHNKISTDSKYIKLEKLLIEFKLFQKIIQKTTIIKIDNKLLNKLYLTLPSSTK